MIYQFLLTFTPTDGTATNPRTCHPVYGDSLATSIDRENGEWYYKRKLDGDISFIGDDYEWIMSQPFDGTFTLDISYNRTNTVVWRRYLNGDFSRANLSIDEDNRKATLNGFIEGVYNAIENGKDEDYDLMKLIPDGDAKEVQGQVHPALAMVDEHSTRTKPSISDIFCDSAMQSGGYNEDTEMFWASDKNMHVNPNGRLQQIVAEAKVIVRNNSLSHLGGLYTGTVGYATLTQHGTPQAPDVDYYINSTVGELKNQGNFILKLSLYHPDPPLSLEAFIAISLGSTVVAYYSIGNMGSDYPDRYWYSPMYIKVSGTQYSIFETIEIKFHYIYSSLLTQSAEGVQENILDTGDYYQGIAPFQGSGLTITPTIRTVEQPNGHRLLPGTGEQGTTPQYYAPPTDNDGWIPLAEDNWDYASMWYKIVPSVANGLLDPEKIGSFRWTRCWPLGTVLRYLLDRITDGKVIFTEDTTSSQFLYSTVNPVNQHEPFDYLITQKSNVMRPSSGESAARCPVRLNWFLELLRNAFNCYYWLEKQNDGRYLFRVEHVEYFRRGGHYDGTLPAGIDITTLKPRRNFRNQLNQLAKTYADQTNKYKYELNNMVEKYTFSWQGDGGSDDFKGNPMYFKAGWVEPSSSEDHQVDNIFADLDWLMLNSGTDTKSSKNYDGVFLFSGYRPIAAFQIENSNLDNRFMQLAFNSTMIYVSLDIWLTIPEGQTAKLQRAWRDPMQQTQMVQDIATYTGTGQKQVISVEFDSAFIIPNTLGIDFGSNYSQVTIHRIHARTGKVYNVPNVTDLLNPANYLQNGPLAWPWLQNEHLHYDIPSRKWCYLHDNLQDIQTEDWQDNGTVKMVQKQEVKVFPMPEKSTEDSIMDITGIRTSIEGGKTGIITNAKVNLTSRNASLTIVYDPVPQG